MFWFCVFVYTFVYTQTPRHPHAQTPF